MKKFLFIVIALLISAASFGQFRGNVFVVPDSTTNFGTSLTAGSLIFDTGSNRIWTITTFASPTDDLEAANKTLVSETQTLTNVLSKGNSTGANDLIIDTGQTIKSDYGNIRLNLNSSPSSAVDSNAFFLGDYENGFVSLDNFGSGIKAINIQNVRDTSETNGANSLYYTFFGYTYLWQTDKTDVSPANHRQGGYNIYANLGGDGIVTNGNIDAPPSSSSVSQAIAKQGVKNTFGAGARYLTMKTDNSFYTNQLILHKGSPTSIFETRLNSVTPTADRDILLQDADGTLALTSQLLENTDITIAANRTITANAGFTINEFGTANIGINNVGSGNLNLSAGVGQWFIQGAGNGTISASTGVNISSSNNNITITPQATTGTVIVGTGANEQSAILQINSTQQGFLPPRMTTGERDAIVNPAAGLIIYNITTDRLQGRRNTLWFNI